MPRAEGMHILLVPSWYPIDDADFGGSFFREQAQSLVHAGHRVGVAAIRGIPVLSRKNFRGRHADIRYALESGVHTYRADKLLPYVRMPAANAGALLRRARSVVGRYIAAHGRPDVLHAHSMFPGGVLTASLAAELHIPYVVTEHRPSSAQLLDRPWYGSAGRAAAAGAGGLVAVAAEFAPVLNQAYRMDSWQYLPGLLSPQFEHLPARPVPTGDFVFGHVSHLDPGKRVDLVIGAFADSFRGRPGVRLRIAGHSEHRAALEDLAAAEGVGQQVEFVGAVPRSGIAAEFAKYHAFVLASSAEAFGTVLWEAQALGLPLISTRTWAGLGAVTPENGLLVPIDDRKSLGAAMSRLREGFDSYDPVRIRRLALAHCGEQAFVGQYEELYRKAGDG